jgi:hypothetical protein
MRKPSEFQASLIFLFALVSSLSLINFKTLYKTVSSDAGILMGYDFGKGKETTEITGDNEFNPGNYEYQSVTFKQGSLKLKQLDNEGYLTIRATKKIIVEKDFLIDVSGDGYRGALSWKETINTGKNFEYAGNGGSSGGRGGSGDCRAKQINENDQAQNTDSLLYGDGGGIAINDKQSRGGNGGGYLLLTAPEIIIKGEIKANGKEGWGTGGGGGGGKIALVTNRLELSGKISANGANGHEGLLQGSGGGSGGVIFLAGEIIEKGKLDVIGGTGGKATDIYSGCDGGKGEDGKIFTTSKNNQK